MEEKMEVHIEVFVNTYDDIKDIVKLSSDIQKERQRRIYYRGEGIGKTSLK